MKKYIFLILLLSPFSLGITFDEVYGCIVYHDDDDPKYPGRSEPTVPIPTFKPGLPPVRPPNPDGDDVPDRPIPPKWGDIDPNMPTVPVSPKPTNDPILAYISGLSINSNSINVWPPYPPNIGNPPITTGGGSDCGDPLLFGKNADVVRNWPEQHESFLTEFDLFSSGDNVTLSRTITEGFTIFVDLDYDGKLSNGNEWLFNPYYNVYQMLESLDFDKNGYVDYKDPTWLNIMVMDSEKNVVPIVYTSIIGFNVSETEFFGNDEYGLGQYSDCMYEGVLRDGCKSVSDQHFRLVAWNEKGVILYGGNTMPTYGIVMGYLK